MDFFYGGWDSHSKGSHTITDEHIDVIRQLRFRMGESGYYSPMPTWSFDDNEELLTEKGLTMNEVWKSAQFITLLGTTENMPGIFERLLRHLYLNEDDEDGFRTGYKRPFGNSNVLGDVRHALIDEGFYGSLTEEEEEGLYEDYEEEQKVLESFMKWLTEDFFKNFEIRFRSFEFTAVSHHNLKTNMWEEMGVKDSTYILSRWKLDKADERRLKLKSIGI